MASSLRNRAKRNHHLGLHILLLGLDCLQQGKHLGENIVLDGRVLFKDQAETKVYRLAFRVRPAAWYMCSQEL